MCRVAQERELFMQTTTIDTRLDLASGLAWGSNKHQEDR